MKNFYKIAMTEWENADTFEVVAYPTVVGFVTAETNPSPAYITGNLELGQIYLDGKIYNNPSEIPQ